MANACDDLSKTCPVCDRRGLLIMPAIYAVARADVPPSQRAPALDAGFGAHLAPIALPAQTAHYTLRGPRTGYIYVFNEKLGVMGWKGYQVNQRGYLSAFDPGKTPAAPPTGAVCGRRITGQAARCISIPDARNVGNVWLAFTDTPWTPAVFARFRDRAEVRQKIMRKFDGAAWVASQGKGAQSHVAPAIESLRLVSEYALGDEMITANRFGFEMTPQAFVSSKADFSTRKGEIQSTVTALTMASDGVAPALIALDDPTGIATDLNTQVFDRVFDWTEEPSRKWKRESAHTIYALREAVKHGAMEQVSAERSSLAGALSMLAPAHTSAVYRGGSVSERMEYAGYITEDEAEKIGKRVWDEDHLDLYREKDLQTYLNETYPAELKAFEQSTLNPLDACFLAWLKSEAYRNHFEYNFDTKDLASGHAYTQKVFLALADAAGRREVFKYVEEELGKDPAQSGSVLLRALMLNQDALINEWAASIAQSESESASSLELDPFKWDKIAEKTWSGIKKILKTDQYKAITGGNPEQHASTLMDTIAKYTYHLNGPLLNILGKVFDQAASWAAAKLPEKRLVGLLGAVAKAGNPNLVVISLRSHTTRKMAVRHVARAIESMSERSNLQYRSTIREMLDRYEDSADTRYAYNAILLVDKAQAGRLSALSSHSQRAERAAALSQSVQSIEEVDRVVARSIGKLFSTDVKANMVASVLSALTLRSAWSDMQKAGAKEKTERMAAFAGAIATLCGAMVEAVGGVLEATPWGVTSHGIALRGFMARYSTKAKLLGFVGKLLGAVGSFVSGVLAFVEGARGMGISKTYGLSMVGLGLFGIAGALLTLTGWLPVTGIVLAIVVAVITLVVGYFKPTNVQKWLNQSYWGKEKDFETQAEEIDALKALQGA